jgi:riboflavin-specific deaminase-like protein
MDIHRLSPGADGLDDEALLAAYRPDASDGLLRVNFATSVDGAVSVHGRSAGLSGTADKRVFGLLRALCDGLLVGAGTVRREGYRAVRLDERRRAWREEQGMPTFPTPVVVSGRLDLDPDQAIFADAPVRPIVLTRTDAPAARRAAVAAVADVVEAGTGRVDLTKGLALLRERGLGHLLCEGGPHLFGTLTAADLVDEVCLTVSPLLAGGGAGRITAGPASPVRRMRLADALAADGSLLLRYRRAEPGTHDPRD